MKLIIFDLDQTLVDFAQLHNEVTHRLLKEFFGVEAWLTEVEHAGRSQRDGMRNLAELKGVTRTAFDSSIDRMLERFGIDFAAGMPAEPSRHVLPGAVELLDGLSRAGHVLALYTGDAPGVVEAVLQATGLSRYFSYRFSGTQVKQRHEMVKMAIERAEADFRSRFEGRSVVVIGDSLRDVECGRLFGAFAIGVATGYYSAQELAAAGADLVVGSLQEKKVVLDAIG
jgi:phosphoglycolate phosphatase-like HAD superfamily hydrolase